MSRAEVRRRKRENEKKAKTFVMTAEELQKVRLREREKVKQELREREDELAERSGLKRRVYPHLFRKTTATNMVKRGCPRELVAFYLGHKNGDARTLNKHYAATTPDQVLGAFRKYGAAA